MDTAVYESLEPISSSDAQDALRSGDPGRIGRALLRMALHGRDWGFAERAAIEHTTHPDVWVRRNAATALGHIARVAGCLEDEAAAVSALLRLLRDPETYGYADDALDDLETFLPINRGAFLGIRGLRSLRYDGSTVEVDWEDGRVSRYDNVDPTEYRDAWTGGAALLEWLETHRSSGDRAVRKAS